MVKLESEYRFVCIRIKYHIILWYGPDEEVIWGGLMAPNFKGEIVTVKQQDITKRPVPEMVSWLVSRIKCDEKQDVTHSPVQPSCPRGFALFHQKLPPLSSRGFSAKVPIVMNSPAFPAEKGSHLQSTACQLCYVTEKITFDCSPFLNHHS